MTFKQLQTLAMVRLGDEYYTDSGSPSITNISNVKVEIQAAYERAINVLAEHGSYVTYTEEDVTFASGTQEKNLLTELSARPRKLLYAGIYPGGSTSQEPVSAIFPRQGNRARARQRGSWNFNVSSWPSSARPFMFLRGYYVLGFVRKPTSQQIVQVGYAPVAESLSGDSDVPIQVPPEHHEYIAQLAAFNLAGAENSPQISLRETLYALEENLRTVGTNFNAFSFNIPGV